MTAGDLWFLNSRIRIVLAQAENADRLSILEHRAAFDDAPPLHVHRTEDETFYVLTGTIRMRVGDRDVALSAGDAFCAPQGVPHGFRVTSREGATFLTVTRGGFEAMVRSASRPAETDGLPPFAEPSAAQQEMLAKLCAAQQIELLGPPIA